MTLNRRHALALAGAGLGASACATEAGPAPGAGAAEFRYGVASGDPARDSIVLWTHAGAGQVPLEWQVAEDAGFARVVARGRAEAGPARGGAVKVVAGGLKPGREHWYRFTVRGSGQASPVGRFRTLPDEAEEVVLALVSCALHPGGLFNAYDAIARLEQVDAVVHLGDYIYEYGAADTDYGLSTGRRLGRVPEPPREIVSLEDYRARHAQYKSDPDLQAAHARAAWITVWDDHEVTNDGWVGGAENHDPAQGEGDWAARKANALRAYYEWMPIREPGPGRSAEMINRTFRFGGLASLHMVETRLLARSEQLSYERDLPVTGGRPDLAAFRARLQDPDRRLLGDGQLEGLERDLRASARAGVRWQLLGNQVVMGRVRGPNLIAAAGQARVDGLIASLPETLRPIVTRLSQLFVNDLPFNLDSWDGYPAERERLYAVLRRSGARPVVLAGDSHAFWVNELKDAAGARVAAEFGTTAVSSPSYGDVFRGMDLGAVLAGQSEEVVFADQNSKGFTLLRLTPEAAVGELIAVSTIVTKPYETQTVARYRVPAAAAGVGAPERV